MDHPWKKMDINEILNSDATSPGLVAQYARIMQHRTIEAMNGLSNRLDKAIVQVVESSAAQDRQQSAMKWLTGALVFFTLAYTGITGWSALEMHLGNKIQSQVAQAVEQQAAAAREANVIQREQLSKTTLSLPEINQACWTTKPDKQVNGADGRILICRNGRFLLADEAKHIKEHDVN